MHLAKSTPSLCNNNNPNTSASPEKILFFQTVPLHFLENITVQAVNTRVTLTKLQLQEKTREEEPAAPAALQTKQ